MNRVFLSGDTHGDLDLDKVTEYFEDMALYDDELSKDDYLIILGDAGILWDSDIMIRFCYIEAATEQYKNSA